VARDVPGFIVNRVLIPMINEAVFAFEEGVASAEDIDLAMTTGANHPVGPLALADRIGLDTVLAITQVLYQDLGDPKFRPCPLLRRYVEAGWLGRKTGRGFFVYEEAPLATRPSPPD
jgi:3-hydroxybutyryl-CoA dehydrogenase